VYVGADKERNKNFGASFVCFSFFTDTRFVVASFGRSTSTLIMTSRVIQPLPPSARRPGITGGNGGGGGGAYRVEAQSDAAAASVGNYAADLRGVQRTVQKTSLGTSNDDVVDERIRAQRAKINQHLPDNMRVSFAEIPSVDVGDELPTTGDRTTDESELDTDQMSTELVAVPLMLSSKAHDASCLACDKGQRRDLGDDTALAAVRDVIAKAYNGKNLETVTNSVFKFARKMWPKFMWTKDSIRYHIKYIVSSRESALERQILRVDTMLEAMDESAMKILDKKTGKTHPNLKAIQPMLQLVMARMKLETMRT